MCVCEIDSTNKKKREEINEKLHPNFEFNNNKNNKITCKFIQEISSIIEMLIENNDSVSTAIDD